jgi:hypothetical protein
MELIIKKVRPEELLVGNGRISSIMIVLVVVRSIFSLIIRPSYHGKFFSVFITAQQLIDLLASISF